MSERTMTAKGFLHKANGKAANSAEAFLKQHRAWLETGDLAHFTSPILRRLDEKELLPTPALKEIKDIVFAHHMAEEVRKAEASMDKEARQPKQKDWVATIYDSKGNVQTRLNDEKEEVLLIQGFDNPGDADRWCDRRLFDGATDWYGVVVSTTLFRGDGEPISQIILRQDAIARILRSPKGPVTQTKGVSVGRLSGQMKVKGDHFHFSKG